MNQIRSIALSFRVAWEASARGLVLSVVLITASQLAPVMLGLLLGRMTTAVLGNTPSSALQYAVGLAVVVSTSRVFAVVGTVALIRLGDRTAAQLDRRLVQAEGRLPDLSHFDDSEFADDLDRVTSLRAVLATAVPAAVLILAEFVTLATGVVALVIESPAAALVLVAAVIPVMSRNHAEKITRAARERLLPTRRDWRETIDLATDSRFAEDVRSNGLGEGLERRAAILSTNVIMATSRAGWRSAAVRAGGSVTWSLCVGGATAYVATQRDVGSAVTAVLILARVGDSVRAIADSFKSWGLLTQVVDGWRSVERRLRGFGSVAKSAFESERGVLELIDVSFSYPKTDRPALRSVSFTLRPGEVVAIVGANGSGKSTLLKIVGGLYKPSTGTLRRPNSVVTKVQAPTRWPLSLREFMLLGTPQQSDSQIVAALGAVELGGLLNVLPEGLDTNVSRDLSGLELSGGELQRLAIARATLSDARLLLFDEPDKGLDPGDEAKVLEAAIAATRSMNAKSSVLIVSHNFRISEKCDRVLMFDNGVLVESGTHAELIQRGGRYADLHNVRIDDSRRR